MPDPTASVVLAEVVRSGFVEGRHRGSLVVLDPDGSVALARGDLRSPVFPRSSNKLMQAAGLVELGYPGHDELTDALARLNAHESEVSDVRRGVQKVMDLLSAEIGGRYRDGRASVEDLLVPEAGA